MVARTDEMTAGQRLEAAEQASLPRTDDPEGEAARLREGIAQTRAEIGSTLGALQEKLSPAALADQAKTAVREATIGKVENMVHTAESTIIGTSHSLGDTIRRHPFSAALAGIGVAWLLFRRRSEGGRYYPRGGREIGPGERHTRGEYVRVEEEGMTEGIKRGAGDMVHRVGEMAEGARESVSHATHEAGERVKSATREAGERVRSAAREVKERGYRIENRLEDAFHDNPLAAGAVALAAGAAVGLAIPITRREEQWMGKARDQVVEKVSEMAQEAMTKVQETTREMGEEAQQTLPGTGVGPQEVPPPREVLPGQSRSI